MNALSFVANASNANRKLIQSTVDLTGLLSHVVHGKQTKVQAILQKHPELITVKGRITDDAGRTFLHASPWQCMLWSLDTRFMGQMMLNCLPAGKEGKVLREELIAQYEEIQGGGSDLVNLAGESEPTELAISDLAKLFNNENAILLWKNKLYYVDKITSRIDKIALDSSQEQSAELSTFIASVVDLRANKARKTTTTEHALIASQLGYSLTRKGLHYELHGIAYCDSHYDFGGH